MAHELVDAVTATPVGPITVLFGQTLDITASFTLNGPPPGSPTSSTYTLTWQRVGLGATIASESPVSANTDYTKTIAAPFLPIGTHQFKVEASVQYDPFDEQYVDSNLITVIVKQVREVTAPDEHATEQSAPAESATESSAPAESATESASPTLGASGEKSAPSDTVTEV